MNEIHEKFLWKKILVLLFVIFLIPVKATEVSDEQKSITIADAILDKLDAWQNEAIETRPAYNLMIDRLLSPLSKEEIRLLGRFQSAAELDGEIFRRWALFDAAAAFHTTRKVEEENAAEIKLAGTSLEGGPGQGMQAYVFKLYLGATRGWAEKSPKEAWKAFKSRSGVFSKSLVIDDFTTQFYEVIFEQLAKKNADFAFKEFLAADLGEYEELHTVAILNGYLRTAPRGRDWKKELDQVLARPGKRDWRFFKVLQADFMGRWLEDSPEAAQKWFKEGKIENLHWSQKETQIKRHHLGKAAGYWAARDFPAAFLWIKSHDMLSPEGFSDEFIEGMSSFFYDDYEREDRNLLLKGITGLPEQEDRERMSLLCAKKLWFFDDWQYINAPPPDKEKWLEGVQENLKKLRLGADASKAILKKL